MEEQQGNVERTRHVYQRAVANAPPVLKDKFYWKRYIYIWLNYALFEETSGDSQKAELVYKNAIELVPHE